MTQPQGTKDRKTQIAEQIAVISRLLGMIPSDDTVQLTEPITDRPMTLAEWLDRARDSHLKLSVLIGKELDIPLQ